MSISVADALKLPSFYGAQILAGSRGLDRQVRRISVVECPEFPLDANIAGKENHLFEDGDFFISSLYAIKDTPELLLDTVKLYNKFNSSGLCIINRYFKTIPQEVANYANEVNYPIIMVEWSVAYADIITDVSRAILSSQNNHVAISIINDILNEDDPENIMSLAYTLNNKFYDNIVVFCLKTVMCEESKIRFLIGNLNNIKNLYCVSYYDNVLICISSQSKITDKDIDLHINNIKNVVERSLKDYYIGISNSYESLKNLKDAIEEALTACKVSKITKNKVEIYSKIGSYQLLLDIKNKNTLKKFYNELIGPLIEYDENKNGKLVETLFTYVQNDGDIGKTAFDLFQHENTIRYRILKVKQLLGLTEESIKFYETISLAYKISKIIL